MLRNNFFPYLAAICVALMLVFLPTHTAFANEEAEKHNEQGDAYYEAKKYEDAMKEYMTAIEIEEKTDKDKEKISMYQCNVGWVHFNLKKYDKAEEIFNAALANDPDNPNAYRGLATVYKAQNKNDEAIKNFVEAGKNYADLAKEHEEAVNDFTIAINLSDKKDKATAEFYNLRGASYYKWDDKHYDAAINDFKEAIRLNPDVSVHYHNLAWAYNKTGKTAEAKKTFLKAGISYYNESRYDKATRDLNRVLELDKDCGEAYYWLGEIEIGLSNEQEAIAKFDEAIRLGFAEDFVYTARGRAKCAMKDYDGAIKDFDKAIDIDVNHADAYAGRGETYFTSSPPDYEKARDDFQQYLELDAKNLNEETKESYEDKIAKCENAIRSSDPNEKINQAADKLGVGEVNYLLKFLIVVMILEYLMFIGCGLHEKTLTGKAAAQEFAIKIIFLMFIMLAKALENWKFLEELEIRNATIAVILVLEFTTLLKGAKERLGIPVPDSIMNLVQTIEDGIKEKLRNIFGG